MRVFEVRMMMRTFVPKSEKVIEGRRQLHSEKFHTFYYSSDIIREIYLRQARCM
jgi:hypothetical protein